MRHFLLALALIAALPAAAQDMRWPDPSQILVPPARFDNRIRPYKGSLRILRVPRADVGRVCRLGPRALACAIVHSPLRCTIVLPHGAPLPLLRAFLRHELGHCNCDGPVCWTHPDRTH